METKQLKIAGRTIDRINPPYLIAEAGSNHNKSIETAKQLIEAAAESGADAVKWQLFLADELYKPGDQLYDIFKSIEFPVEWLPMIKDHSRKCGVAFIASPFDRKSVQSLLANGVEAFKIASSETVDLKLLGYIASAKLPTIISTGMCDLVDVVEAVNVCNAVNNDQLAVLQCSSLYPMEPEHAHLRVLDTFKAVFRYPLGYSDHSLGLAVSVAAVARGAVIIEKHLTLDKKSNGPDHFYALEPAELKTLRQMLNEAHASLGSPEKSFIEDKKIARREGLFATREIKKGETIGLDAISASRPATGIRARYLNQIARSKAKSNIANGSAIQWADLDFQ